MNSLSWLIYLSQVCDSLGVLLVFLGCIWLATYIGWFIGPRFVYLMDDKTYQGGYPPKTVLVGALVFLILGNLMPTQKTMLAIAASQVGERVVNSEAVTGIASDATKALQVWIHKQLEPDEKKSK